MISELIYQIIFWVGLLLILLAYFLISFKKVKPGKFFHFINLAGGICLFISSICLREWIVMILGILWIILSVLILTKILKPNKEYKDWT